MKKGNKPATYEQVRAYIAGPEAEQTEAECLAEHIRDLVRWERDRLARGPEHYRAHPEENIARVAHYCKNHVGDPDGFMLVDVLHEVVDAAYPKEG